MTAHSISDEEFWKHVYVAAVSASENAKAVADQAVCDLYSRREMEEAEQLLRKGPVLAEVEAFAKQEGRKIQSIKALRKITYMGLSEAKSAVEFFMRNGTWQDHVLAAVERHTT